MQRKKISWSLEKRSISDLKDYSKNPRKATEKEIEQIQTSVTKFGLIDKPAINTDNTIIGGHRRTDVLKINGQDEVEVWVPNRELTEKEVEELNIRLNKNTGSFDFDILANEFKIEDLKDWGFEDYEFGMPDSNELGDGFSLPDGDRGLFQQITFTLSDEQADYVKNAISEIKATDDYKYCETFGNENSNGNALYLIVSQWAGQRK